MDLVHDFITDKGKIISVTPNVVATSNGTRQAGRWMVVADNGTGNLSL